MQGFSNNILLSYKNLYGLIGFPLSHSFSKNYFAQKFETEAVVDSFYEVFPIDKIELFPAILKTNPNFKGLNVTIPYKEDIISYLNYLDEGARAIRAVNCIKIENGFLLGYNTDAYGFEKSLLEFLIANEATPKQALILGTGGAAKAVAFVLKKLGILYKFVSRDAEKADITYEQLHTLDAYSLVINTTPLGMSPKLESCPDIPYHCLSSRHLLFDLVYNPTETLFLQKGTQQGAATQNGLPMLYYQAEKAWEIWNTNSNYTHFYTDITTYG